MYDLQFGAIAATERQEIFQRSKTNSKIEATELNKKLSIALEIKWQIYHWLRIHEDLNKRKLFFSPSPRL